MPTTAPRRAPAPLGASPTRLDAPCGVGRFSACRQVHYFEDGNVQLDDKAVFQRECPAGADVVGSEFVGKVREIEQQFAAKLEEIYSTMSDSVLQGLRRRLPVTRTKFDWDKLAVAKLAGDLQKAAAVS